MKATWEKIEKNLGFLNVEVEADRVETASIDKAFDKVVKTSRLPGFRKGKVPRSIFEARFGVETFIPRSNRHYSYLKPIHKQSTKRILSRLIVLT